MHSPIHIIIAEPFHSGSHKSWIDGLGKFCDCDIELLALKGRHWKWRMHGGAVTLAKKLSQSSFRPDLIIASDMLDLPLFLAHTRHQTANVPVALYMHENQLTYPWSPQDRDVRLKRDRHYAFTNYASALVADKVLFNSGYHMNVFLDALPKFLKAFPDHRELASVEAIRKKSEVLELALDLNALDIFKCPKNRKPAILWNHRWEYDKSPEDFFSVLFRLSEKGMDFDLIVLGESGDKYPVIFDEARQRLSAHILHWGYAKDAAEYAGWLWKANILPVTSRQDFFGMSTVEAMYCQCHPILPDRLAYPGHIPHSGRNDFIYSSPEMLEHMLIELVSGEKELKGAEARSFVSRYDWKQQASTYNRMFRQLAASPVTP
ncbi:MAG: DUF3524 domain-containing protein [Flavobacteriales bacterium]|nr:DUF3524 domain-containing protein [Flavobacteriales bacterium]